MKTSTWLCFFVLCIVSCKEDNTRILNTPILSHPRLLYTAQEEKPLSQLLKSDPLLDSLQILLLAQAETLLSAPLQKHELRNMNYAKDMLMISREQVSRMITLSLAYRISGDQRFSQKAAAELVNVCRFPDWNPKHFLDVAEMTTAVAIAYDWLYDILPDTTKKLVVESIKAKALDEAFKVYETGNEQSWAQRETNWNVVCNTGMVLGALAIAEHYPDEAGKVIENAVKFIPNCLKHFAPDGVCYEGPAYWGYTTTYLSLLLKALNDNFGQDFGLSAMEGIKQTALYYVHSTSPSGKVFNFANSGGTAPDTNPMYFYFSKHFNQPEIAACYRHILSEKVQESKAPGWFFFLSIPWFDNTVYDTRTPLNKLNVYKGINDIAVFNGNKNTPDFIYLIAKGGDPDMAHQQLDVGTFVIESNGVRWSDDLGADDYSLPGFWDYKPDGQRWKYFRNTNFSHNTLSIDGKIQHSAGTGKITAYDSKIAQPYVTIDMSTVYAGQAKSVNRTFCLLDDTNMLVSDEVELLSSEQTLQWSMITEAEIQCSGNQAILNRNGKQFYLKILSPSNAKFVSTPAVTYTSQEIPVEGYHLLTVSVSGLLQQNLKIQMSSEQSLLQKHP